MIRRVVLGVVAGVLVIHSLFGPVAGADELPAENKAPLVVEAKQSQTSEQGKTEEFPVQPAIPSASLAPLLSSAEEEPPLVLPPILINRISAGKTDRAAYDYVELFNPNPHDIFLDSWRVRVLRKETSAPWEAELRGTVKAQSYTLIAANDVTPESDVHLQTDLVYAGGVVQLIDQANTIVEQVAWGDGSLAALPKLASDSMLERKYTEGVPSLSGQMAVDFLRISTLASLPRSGGYQPYVEPINRCAGLMISEIAANTSTDKQFIELYNPTPLPLILDECLLQTNRSTTKSHVLTGTIQPGEYKSVLLSATELTLTKTTSGTVYILSSDGKEEADARSYDGLAAETSWAWFGGSDWRQTFTLTPGVSNMWQEFLPCETGYERNVETGRCRKLGVAVEPVECGPGKYRNPETNRCRAIEVADLLTPCKEGQYRNPETNRCRSIATAASSLTPCRPDQERNPETNRCRKKVAASIPESAFAVEPFQETGKAFVGWWALGGIGTLALGRGVWEWRSEMLAGIRKIASFFTSGK